MLKYHFSQKVLNYSALFTIASTSIITGGIAHAATPHFLGITRVEQNNLPSPIIVSATGTNTTTTTGHPSFIANFITQAMRGTATTIGNIVRTVSHIAKISSSAIGSGLSFIGSTIKNFSHGIGKIIQSTGNFVGSIVQAVPPVIGEVANMTISGVGNVLGSTGLFPHIKSLTSSIGNTIFGFGLKVGQVLSSVPETIGSFIGNSVEKIGDTISNPFLYLGSAIPQKIYGLVNYIDGIPGYISSTATSISQLAQGVSIISGAGNKILKAGGTNFLNDINWVIKTLSSLPIVPRSIKNNLGPVSDSLDGINKITGALEKLFPGVDIPKVLTETTNFFSHASVFVENASTDIAQFAQAVNDAIYPPTNGSGTPGKTAATAHTTPSPSFSFRVSPNGSDLKQGGTVLSPSLE